MATIKEEVMAVKDDCQYVRALDANGNSIRISKEDLAKVLGELIGSVSETKDGLMPHKGFIVRSSIPDLNTMDSGFARVSSDTANLPNGLTWQDGIVVTFRTDAVAGQLFYSSQSGFFIRVLWDSWLEWIKL